MRLAGRLALSHSAALAAGLLAAALLPSAGCLLSLPSVCGDGQVDIEGGEECDPAAASEPLCDPESCTKIILEKCGNATIDPGEQCDLTAFGNKDCPSGKGFLSCTPDCKLDESTCDQCGNGRIDPEAGEVQYKAARLLDLQLRPQEALMRYQRFLLSMDIERIRAQGDANAKMAEAIAILGLVAEAWPQSANTYDSLGEAYARSGDKAKAIENYQRSLDLDPNNANAATMLKQLKAQ